MFKHILNQVDRHFPFANFDISEKEWTERVLSLMPSFSEEVDQLISDMIKMTPKRILKESKVEHLHPSKPSITLCEIRLRPQNKYYKDQEKLIPSPENPEGLSATGIETNISLLRGFKADNVIYPAMVSIAFRIWGEHERNAFIHFYENYKRMVEIFLRELHLQFEAACWFDNVEKYKGKDIMKKLDLYFLNKDDECCFKLGSIFYGNADPDKILRTFLTLIAIYDSCFGYAKKRRDIDRILFYYPKLMNSI